MLVFVFNPTQRSKNLEKEKARLKRLLTNTKFCQVIQKEAVSGKF